MEKQAGGPVFHFTPDICISDIINTLPPYSTVCLAPGIYREKITIRTPNLTLIGAGSDKTKIVWDDYALKKDEKGDEYVTFRTFTLAVCADNVTFKNLTIANDALFPEKKGQEVALTVYGDNFLMEDCTLSSTQDTLFTGPLPPDLQERYITLLPDYLRSDIKSRQTYRHCLIEGTVDFIFGSAECCFTECEIRSLYEIRGKGFAAAPSHRIEFEKGYLFDRCNFTCAEGVPAESVFLARPWRDYGYAAFKNCVYGPHIIKEGFDKWNDTNRDKTARFYEKPLLPGRVSWAKEYKD